MAEASELLDSALDLMRRLPPTKVEENLGALISLVPLLTEDLLSTVDQPLKVKLCQKSHREYLLCDYNRDGDSFRSPYSNIYDPPLEDGTVPSASLRQLEITANEAFNVYRDLYFEGGLTSVYMWDMENDGFACAILFKKIADSGDKMKGAWDSIHVVEVELKGKSAHYKLTSSILLYLLTSSTPLGTLNLSGNLTRQSECTLPFSESNDHIVNIGRTVEEMENKMRGSLQEIYFGKTKDVVHDLRSTSTLSEIRQQAAVQREIISKMQERK